MNNLNDLNREKNKCLVEIDFDVSSGKFVKHYIHQNFPFALQSRVQSSHSIKMLPLTLQSEIGTSDNTLIKGNC